MLTSLSQEHQLSPPTSHTSHWLQMEASKMWLPWSLYHGDHTAPTSAELDPSRHLQCEVLALCYPPSLLAFTCTCTVYDSPTASALQETPREFSNHFLHLQPPFLSGPGRALLSPVCSQFQLYQLLMGPHGQRHQARHINWSTSEPRSHMKQSVCKHTVAAS